MNEWVQAIAVLGIVQSAVVRDVHDVVVHRLLAARPAVAVVHERGILVMAY